MEIPTSSMPRERLLERGVNALSDQELLAILLRTGTKEMNVIELAGKVLTHFPNLFELKQADLPELLSIKGIGQIKAVELQAAMELGYRIHKSCQPKFGRVTSSFQLAHQMIDELKDEPQEHLVCLYLNTKNEIIQKNSLFTGSLDQSIAHPREIFRAAVRCSAARIIVCHNHPSGNPEPSENDRVFTKRLIRCGDLMGVEVLDHIVVGHESYVSLRERGLWQ